MLHVLTIFFHNNKTEFGVRLFKKLVKFPICLHSDSCAVLPELVEKKATFNIFNILFFKYCNKVTALFQVSKKSKLLKKVSKVAKSGNTLKKLVFLETHELLLGRRCESNEIPSKIGFGRL
jgi:hypothetical protein